MPTRARTREVLPAPLGPMIPSAWPVLSEKCALVTIGFVPPGGRTTRCSTSRLRAGCGSAVTSRFGAARVSASDSRVMLWRAAMKARQLAIAVSIGRERAAHHDRGGDHGAGGHFLADHEIGAQTEDHRLQQEPQHLRYAAEGAGDVAQAGDGRDVAVVDPCPTLSQRPGHSHRHDGLAAAALRLHHDLSACPRPARPRARGAAGAFGQQRHREQGDGADQRRHAEPGMNEETDGQEHRDPGQIDDGDRTRAGQKAADLIEVADRLGPIAGVAARDGEADHRAMHGQREALVEQRRGADHDARADQVEGALEGIGADQEDRKRDQRRHAPAAQHPVVDLQHVERAGEHQQVHDAREQRHAPERAPAIAQSRGEVGMDRGFGCKHCRLFPLDCFG